MVAHHGSHGTWPRARLGARVSMTSAEQRWAGECRGKGSVQIWKTRSTWMLVAPRASRAGRAEQWDLFPHPTLDRLWDVLGSDKTFSSPWG